MEKRRDGSVAGKGGRINTAPLSHESGFKGLSKYIDD
jgi:hypothetical protein